MCTIIDMNVFPIVFNQKDPKHKEFKPILDWINKKNGKIVLGGTKYKDELRLLKKYWPIIIEYSKKGKVVNIDDSKVDAKEKEIKADLIVRKITTTNKDYNDPHLVALVAISKVKVITSLDYSSMKFLRESKYYDRSTDRPVFYTRKKNISLTKEPKYYGSCCCN